LFASLKLIVLTLASEFVQVRLFDILDRTYDLNFLSLIGRLMALEVLFITCAMTLAVFDISKAVVNGKVAEPDGERSEGVVRYSFVSFNFSSTELTSVVTAAPLLLNTTSSHAINELSRSSKRKSA
jgi:hypothetical protein